MTTFQDPQPQSRRAVRQSERAENAENPAATAQPAGPQFIDPEAPREMWDTTARRAAQLPATPRHEPPAAGSGRRAAVPPVPVAEPLTYSTQQRPILPNSVVSNPAPPAAPAFRNRPAGDSALPPTQAMPRVDQPSYRVRDFSPEGRRSAAPSDSTWGIASPAPATDLDYHTAAKASRDGQDAGKGLIDQVPPAVAPVAAPPVRHVAAPPVSEVPLEHTLTRRELRAMGNKAPAPLVQPPAPEAQQASDQQASPFARPETPVAQPAAGVAESESNDPSIVDEVAPVQPEISPFDALFRSPTSPPPLVVPKPAAGPTLANAMAEFDSLTSVQPSAPAAPPAASAVTAAAVPAPTDEPTAWSPPAGHWSTQVEPHEILPENTINRTIGSGTSATNALVLPSAPQGADIRGPLTSTGEIMLTGSIDLPRNLAATGQTDRFDNGGIDALFDLSDAEVISTDSSPVRAIRAVSTHTSGHGVTHTQKPKGNRALTGLLIAASSMAVVVAGLLVLAFAFNVF
jgi:hypothetical protein